MAKKRSIIENAMRYHGIVALLVVILIIAGVAGLILINKNEFPTVTIRQGLVVAVYPGASSNEVESRVTTPLENYIFSYNEVKKSKVASTSKDGMAILQVELNEFVNDRDGFWSKFKHGVQQFKANLPAGVLAIAVIDDFGDASSLLMTIDSDVKTYRELNDYLKQFEEKLRRIPSVGRITRIGMQNEQISVYLDAEKLSQYKLGWKSTMALLGGQGLVNISGTLRDGDRNYPLYVKSNVNSLEDVKETVVYAAPDGNVVRLKDVARVVREYPDPDSYVTVDGRRALVLSVEMKQNENIVAMGEEIYKALDEYQATLPEGVNLSIITDQSKVVGDSVVDFLKELLIAFIAVILVIMILQPIKVALISAMTIPITIFISMGLFYVLGFELNSVTLAALIVTLGMIVDNSIVIIDDYMEKINEGANRWSASAGAASHFFKSIVSATLAISLTFFPFLATLTGMFKDFVTYFPWAQVVVLSVSLMVAVLLMPFAQFYFLRPRKKREGKSGAGLQAVLLRIYEPVLNVCFKHPAIVILTGILSLVVGVVWLLGAPVKLMPIAQRDQLSVEIYLPSGTSLDKTVQVADSLEKILKQDPRVKFIASFKGLGSPRFHLSYAPQMGGPNYAQFIVNTESIKATDALIYEYAQKYSSYFPEAQVRFKQLTYALSASPIEVRLYGAESDVLKRASEKVVKYLEQDDDIYFIRSSLKEPLAGIDISLNENASKFGITPLNAETILATRYSGGLPVASVWEGEYATNVVVKGIHGDSAGVQDLMDERMPTYMGLGNVPLRQVADITPTLHEGEISHRNGVKTVTISAEISAKRSATDYMLKNREEIEKLCHAEGVQVEIGGDYEDSFTTLPGLFAGLIFSAVIIFFILVYHYKSLRLAIMLIVSLGLCMFGTAFGIRFMGMDMSITCFLGVVSLMGILVRNAIIMIDYAIELQKKEGLNVKDSIYNSALRRMRPIFLTSAAASMGVIPMILGGSSLWMAMGCVVCFGTLITMLFILTVLPIAYWGVVGKFRD